MQDLSTASINRAMDANLAAFIPLFGRLGQAFEDNPPGVHRAVTAIPLPLFNSVMATRLEAKDVKAAVETVQADALARRIPVLWWQGPTSRPVDLGDRLERLGFTVDEEGPGMALDLAKLQDTLPPVPGLSIQQVDSETGRRQWAHSCAMGFEVPAGKVAVLEDAWLKFLNVVETETLIIYTGLLDDLPVATSMLLMAEGVAGIYAVSTVPSARRKGIGVRMTLTPLLHARRCGYRVGTLQASEMGEGVYRSLGFRGTCRVSSYVWKPEEHGEM